MLRPETTSTIGAAVSSKPSAFCGVRGDGHRPADLERASWFAQSRASGRPACRPARRGTGISRPGGPLARASSPSASAKPTAVAVKLWTDYPAEVA
jgi:hypothetical protein